MKILCPFCSKPYTKKMLDAYNGTYSCESGCEYIGIEIVCGNCDKTVYIKGEFGSFDNEKEKKELISKIEEEEIKEAVDGIEKK